MRLSTADWRDIHDGLMDAVEAHHSGPRADRYAALAKRAFDKALSATDWQVVYEGLIDAASVHHSGARADRYVALARKVLSGQEAR